MSSARRTLEGADNGIWPAFPVMRGSDLGAEVWLGPSQLGHDAIDVHNVTVTVRMSMVDCLNDLSLRTACWGPRERRQRRLPPRSALTSGPLPGGHGALAVRVLPLATDLRLEHRCVTPAPHPKQWNVP